MRPTNRIVRQVLGASVVALVAPIPTAHAYLDPGTGSLIVQMVIGGIAAAGAAITVYWQRIRGIFGIASRRREPTSRTIEDEASSSGDGPSG